MLKMYIYTKNSTHTVVMHILCNTGAYLHGMSMKVVVHWCLACGQTQDCDLPIIMCRGRSNYRKLHGTPVMYENSHSRTVYTYKVATDLMNFNSFGCSLKCKYLDG